MYVCVVLAHVDGAMLVLLVLDARLLFAQAAQHNCSHLRLWYLLSTLITIGRKEGGTGVRRRKRDHVFFGEAQ